MGSLGKGASALTGEGSRKKQKEKLNYPAIAGEISDNPWDCQRGLFWRQEAEALVLPSIYWLLHKGCPQEGRGVTLGEVAPFFRGQFLKRGSWELSAATVASSTVLKNEVVFFPPPHF